GGDDASIPPTPALPRRGGRELALPGWRFLHCFSAAVKKIQAPPPPDRSFRNSRYQSAIRPDRFAGRGIPMITGAWSVAWVLLAAGPAAPEGVPGDVMFSKSKKLEFPIKVDAVRQKDMRQLELYYSTNQGASWNLAATASPTQEKFLFTAPTD